MTPTNAFRLLLALVSLTCGRRFQAAEPGPLDPPARVHHLPLIPPTAWEHRGQGEFSILITGETKSFKGYLHSTAPLTLKQAIEAAGGRGEFAGEIWIYAHPQGDQTEGALKTRLRSRQYPLDPAAQNQLLDNGDHVSIKTVRLGHP